MTAALAHLKSFLLIFTSASYVVVGVLHFSHEAFFVRMMPEFLPWPVALVWVSGVFEILGGLGLLIPRTRRLASWGILALLVAVFPANLHMWLHAHEFADIGTPTDFAIRLPMQAVLAAIAYWVGLPNRVQK